MSSEMQQKELLQDARTFADTLISYKEASDTKKQLYDKVIRCRDEFLAKAQDLGLPTEAAIQIVYDIVKNQLSEWYVRKLFSGDLNRRMLPNKPEDPDDDYNKKIEESKTKQYSKTIPSGQLRNNIQDSREITIVELDLVQALENGLKAHIFRCEKKKTAFYIVKLSIEDGLLKGIEPVAS